MDILTPGYSGFFIWLIFIPVSLLLAGLFYLAYQYMTIEKIISTRRKKLLAAIFIITYLLIILFLFTIINLLYFNLTLGFLMPKGGR